MESGNLKIDISTVGIMNYYYIDIKIVSLADRVALDLRILFIIE
jgi:hypothetical protein